MKRLLIIVTLLLVWAAPAQAEQLYSVQYNDTLATIAARHGMTPVTVARMNGIVNPARIQVGQQLMVANPPLYNVGGSVYLYTHEVQPGEYLKQIAEGYGVGWEQLLALNQMEDPNAIQAGMQLSVMVIDSTQPGTTKPLTTDTISEQGLLWLTLRHDANLAAVQAYNGLDRLSALAGTWITVPMADGAPRAQAEAAPDVAPTAPPPSSASSANSTATPDITTPTVEVTNAAQVAGLWDPSDDWTPYPLPPAAPFSEGDLSVSFGAPIYQHEGRQIRIDITVRNNAIQDGITTGWYYFGENSSGGQQWVSLLGVKHDDVPVAKIDTAPLWQARVTFTDGNVWTYPVGCYYERVLHYEGFEPTGPNGEGYDWVVHDESGFYDCGNGYQVKREAPLRPGEEWSMPLLIYTQHPNIWPLEIPVNADRQLARVDLGLWTAGQRWLGYVHSVSY